MLSMLQHRGKQMDPCSHYSPLGFHGKDAIKPPYLERTESFIDGEDILRYPSTSCAESLSVRVPGSRIRTVT